MPAYSLKLLTSDNTITTNYALSNNFSGPAIPVEFQPQEVATYNFITPQFYPNTTIAPSGTGTCVINHSVTNMNLSITAQLVRTNSTGTVQSIGATAASQVSASTNTFSVGYPSWTGATCSDRLRLVLVYTNGAMTIQNLTFTTSTSYLLTSLNHNGAGCTVLRKPSWVSTG